MFPVLIMGKSIDYLPRTIVKTVFENRATFIIKV